MQISLPRSPRINPSPRLVSFSCSPIVDDGPITPQEALREYSSLLMPYEIDEIDQYKDIFFLGYPSSKNKTLVDTSILFKFNAKDHIAYRYEIIKSLGSGSFGKVLSVFDHKVKKSIAIKIFNSKDEAKYQIGEEAKILSELNKARCSYTVKGIDFFYFRTHPCISFELLGTNLYVLQAKNNFRPNKLSIVRDIAIQIFRGLNECSQLGIIHCDIKPENICTTVDDSRKVKIIDFGSSVFENSKMKMRYYIQSRYYRSPEVILRLKYGPKIDIWSAALVLLELLTGKQILPGKNELEMLNLMADLIGPIPRSMAKACKKKSFFNDDGSLRRSSSLQSTKMKLSLQYLLDAQNSPQFADFIKKCLNWKPNFRMSASQALKHPWLQSNSTYSESLPCLNKY